MVHSTLKLSIGENEKKTQLISVEIKWKQSKILQTKEFAKSKLWAWNVDKFFQIELQVIMNKYLLYLISKKG